MAEHLLADKDLGSILWVFQRKNSKTQSSLKFPQSGLWKFTTFDLFGLGPDPVSSNFLDEKEMHPGTLRVRKKGSAFRYKQALVPLLCEASRF